MSRRVGPSLRVTAERQGATAPLLPPRPSLAVAMLAPPPPPVEVDFNVQLRRRFRARRSVSTTDEDDSGWQTDSPSSPDEAPRTTSWKRKRLGETEDVEVELDRLQLGPHERLHAMSDALAATQRKLEEAQTQLAQMCALATAANTHECELCCGAIGESGSAVFCQSLCHFCHDCLRNEVEKGTTACPKCGEPASEVRRDPEFDVLLRRRIVDTMNLAAEQEEVEKIEAAAAHALAGPGRVVSVEVAMREQQAQATAVAKGVLRQSTGAAPSKAAASKVTFAWPRWPAMKR